MITFLKKLFYYFLLFTGLILSTSHLGDNFMGISDEEGYLLTIGICCLTAFFFEYFIRRVCSPNDAVSSIKHVSVRLWAQASSWA